jgi:hypothetical protein
VSILNPENELLPDSVRFTANVWIARNESEAIKDNILGGRNNHDHIQHIIIWSIEIRAAKSISIQISTGQIHDRMVHKFMP